MPHTFTAVGALSSVLSGDARFTLAKNSFLTGVFGLVFLATLVIDQPLMFGMARQFATGGVPEKMTYWDSLWQYGTFRRMQYVMTAVWGLSFVLEAIVRIVPVYAFPVSLNVMQTISEIMVYAVLGLLMCWTVAYTKVARRRGRREAAASVAIRSRFIRTLKLGDVRHQLGTLARAQRRTREVYQTLT